MAEEDSALLYVDVWKQKSFDFSKQSDDVIIPVMMKAFETMAATLEYRQNGIHLQRTLDSLKSEKDISYSYDNVSDPVRELTYGILEAIYRTLKSISTSQSQTTTSTTTMESPPPVDIPLIVLGEMDGCCVKEEKSTIANLKSARAQTPIDTQALIIGAKLGEGEEDVGMGEDEMIEPDSTDVQLTPLEHSSVGEVLIDSDLKEEEMEMGEAIGEPPLSNQATLYENQRIPLDNVKLEMDEELFESIIGGIASSARAVSMAKNGGEEVQSYDMLEMEEKEMEMEEETDEYSINNQTPSTECISERVKRGETKRKMSNGGMERREEWKIEKRKSGLKFKWVGYNPASVLKHCTNKHSSNSTKMGFYFRCECGYVSRSYNSNQCCKIGKSKLIKDKDESYPVGKSSYCGNRTVMCETPMKCPKCEWIGYNPSTVVWHFREKHASTPLQMGVSLRCDCGHVSRSNVHVNSSCKLLKFELLRDEPSMGENDEKEKKKKESIGN